MTRGVVAEYYDVIVNLAFCQLKIKDKNKNTRIVPIFLSAAHDIYMMCSIQQQLGVPAKMLLVKDVFHDNEKAQLHSAGWQKNNREWGQSQIQNECSNEHLAWWQDAEAYTEY